MEANVSGQPHLSKRYLHRQRRSAARRLTSATSPATATRQPAFGDNPMRRKTACNDSNVCTTDDTCQNGVCTGRTRSPARRAISATSLALRPGTGTCSDPIAANGTACNDGNVCTTGDTCQAGAASAARLLICAAESPVPAGQTCDERMASARTRSCAPRLRNAGKTNAVVTMVVTLSIWAPASESRAAVAPAAGKPARLDSR